MLGGYAKPLVIMMAAVMLPIYISVFLVMAFPAYSVYFVGFGLGAMIFLLFALEQYKHMKYMGKRCIALTRRHPGGIDDMVYIVFGTKFDLPKEKGKYVCAIRDDVTEVWYQILSDHPMGDINYLEDTIPVGAFFVKLPVAYVEGAQLRTVKRPLFELVQDRGILAKMLKRKQEPETVVEVPQIYVYGTSATAEKVFAGKPLNSPPPTPEELKNAYAAFVAVDPDYSELQAKCAAYEKELEKLRAVVDSVADRIAEFGDITLVEAGPRLSKRRIVVIVAVAVVVIIALVLAKMKGLI